MPRKIDDYQRAFTLVELLCVIAIIALLAALLFPVFSRAREQGRSAVCLSNMKQMGIAVGLYLQDWDETYPMNRQPDETHPLGGCALQGNSSYPLSTLETSRLDWRRVVQPYLNNKQVMICPSNPNVQRSPFPGFPPGDETNIHYPPTEYLPLSYAYNGNFFHEGIPPCLYGEKLVRPRRLAEIASNSNLILLLESRLGYPDLGNWLFTMSADSSGLGAYQTHNNMVTFLFADLHARRLKLAATCAGKLWSDHFPDVPDSCQNLSQLSNEYR